MLFLGETGVETNQQPCLSLVQFQIEDGQVIISAYQRSSDANLGLPCDIYHLYLMAREIDLPLKSITLFLGNVHIYETNLLNTYNLLNGAQDVKFALNVRETAIKVLQFNAFALNLNKSTKNQLNCVLCTNLDLKICFDEDMNQLQSTDPN